ncbi:MAG: transposase, partial [Solirubrobacterales bacterium]
MAAAPRLRDHTGPPRDRPRPPTWPRGSAASRQAPSLRSATPAARRCEESAPFRWLCGGVSVNHRLLSDFRGDHSAALDELFTQVIASLVERELVRVSRISQDGVRVRVSAGAGSFRREERLQKLLAESEQHVVE